MGKTFIEDQIFNNQDFRTDTLHQAEYDNCTFKSCSFAGTYLHGVNFSECRFVDCDFTSAELSGASIRECTFDGCKLLGLRFEECNSLLFSANFKNCIINLSSFFELGLKKTIFDSCQMHEVDFSRSDLAGAKFLECDLADATFDQTNLEKVDFSSSYNFQIHPENNRIRKAIFSRDGLHGLLSHLDISIT